MSITVKKSTSGASFTVTYANGTTRKCPCNAYESDYDATLFSLIPINPKLSPPILNQPFGQIINGDTSSAFATMADLVTYADANFFRKAGSGTGSLSASNFITAQPLTGTINGSNTVFTIPTAGLLSNIVIKKNGVVQLLGTDYNLSGTTVTFTVVPDPGPGPGPADSLTYDCIAQ